MRSGPRETRQRQGRWRLVRLWRLLVFSGAAVGLAWVLLEKGWWVKTPDQVVFHGASPQERGALVAASPLQFPTPLLVVDPSSMEQQLRRLTWPTLHVQVQRALAPPQLVVHLQNTTAQAWARRSFADRVERGVLDHQFNWIRVDGHHQLDRFPVVRHQVLVMVDFWTPGLQDMLAELFAGLEHLETPVQTVRITADGQLVLGTSQVLREVHLGEPNHLERKLTAMDHLYVHLQRSGPPFAYMDVDLSNPDQPNLSLSHGQS